MERQQEEQVEFEFNLLENLRFVHEVPKFFSCDVVVFRFSIIDDNIVVSFCSSLFVLTIFSLFSPLLLAYYGPISTSKSSPAANRDMCSFSHGLVSFLRCSRCATAPGLSINSLSM